MAGAVTVVHPTTTRSAQNQVIRCDIAMTLPGDYHGRCARPIEKCGHTSEKAGDCCGQPMKKVKLRLVLARGPPWARGVTHAPQRHGGLEAMPRRRIAFDAIGYRPTPIKNSKRIKLSGTPRSQRMMYIMTVSSRN